MIRRTIRRLTPRPLTRLREWSELAPYVMPAGLEGKDLGSFWPTVQVPHPGLNFSEAAQLTRVQRWAESYQPLFQVLRDDPAINTQFVGKPYLHNQYFPTPDAEVYAAMIQDIRPRTILEVGGGYSTLIARKAVDRLTDRCRIVVVDPDPRTEVRSAVDLLIERPFEQITLPELEPPAIVFIDSSHVTRSGGDVPLLYNVVIPTLPALTTVHIHDVFLPWDYPFVYQRRLYTEQYLLQALLAHSPRYEILFACHYMSRMHTEAMAAAFGDIVRTDRHSGASFWFTVNA